MEREVRYCTTEDGVRIAYCSQGVGPVLVITPLFVESFSLFHLVPEIDRILERLQEVRRVVLYDGRGTGVSQRDVTLSPGYTRRDLEAVIAATGEESVALWANMVFVPMVLRLAAQRAAAIERLVLFSALARRSDVFSDDVLRSLAELAKVNWPLAAQTFGDMSTRQADAAAGLRWGELYRQSTSGDVVASVFAVAQQEDIDAHEDLARITAPTLVLHRKGDLNVPLEMGREIASAIPGARFVPLDGVMSAYALGDQESVLRAALPFLSDSASEAPSQGDGDGGRAGAFRAVLFTDLVGHTEMMSRLGDERGREVLREHERITREVLKAHGGTEVKTMGDGFMASFGSVTKAVECAVALQRAFEALTPDPSPAAGEGQHVESLKIRCGLNAGEPIEEDGDLFGATVILAARIAAKADGGEILVADTVRGLCSGKGFLFADRGEFVAKGFEEPVRVYEVRWRDG